MVWEKYKKDKRFRVKTVDSRSVCCFRCDLRVQGYEQTLSAKSGVEVLAKGIKFIVLVPHVLSQPSNNQNNMLYRCTCFILYY